MSIMSVQDLAGLQGRKFTIVVGDVPAEAFEDLSGDGVTLTLRSDADEFFQAQLVCLMPALNGRKFQAEHAQAVEGRGYAVIATAPEDNTLTIHVVMPQPAVAM